MKRNIARIFKKDGAVMFAVLSVMSALIALAVGLLFIVNAERQTLVEQAGEEQVYQMTVSANDFVFDYLNLFFTTTPEGQDISGKDPFLDGVMALNEGETMTFGEKYLTRDLEELPLASSSGASYKYSSKVTMAEIDDTSVPNTTLNTIDITSYGWYKNEDGAWSKDSKSVTRRMVIRTYREPPPPVATDRERYFAVGFGALGGPQKSTIRGPKLDHSIYFGHNEVLLENIKDIKHLGFFGKLTSGADMKFAIDTHIQMSVRNAFVVNDAATRFFESQTKGSTVRIGDYLYSRKPFESKGEEPRPVYLYVLGREPYDNIKLNDGKINDTSKVVSEYIGKSVEAEFFIDDKDIINDGDRASKQIFINGDMLVNTNTECTFFINGDLLIKDGSPKGTFYISGDIIFAKEDDKINAAGGEFYIGGKARFNHKKGAFRTDREPPIIRTADDSADIIMSSGGEWSAIGEGASDDPSRFPWGTYEAWPVFRQDPSNPDLDLSLFPMANPKKGWKGEIPITDFETVEECFDRLNYETVAVSYNSAGIPELSDQSLSLSGRRNYVLLSKPYNGGNLALQTDPDAEPRKVVIDVKPGSGAPDKGNLSGSSIDSGTPNYVATMEYRFLDGGVIAKEDEQKILSPKVYPIWKPEEILSGLGKTDDLIQMGLEPPTGDLGENKIDLNAAFANNVPGEKLIVTSSGYIDTIIPNSAADTVKTLYIDTTRSTDAPDDDADIYILLKRNSGTNKFEWMQNANTKLSVWVQGAGSVVFFLDDDVIYNSGNGNVFIGHEGWDDVLRANDLDYISTSLQYKNVIKNYIHEEKLCDRPNCLYCKDEPGIVGVNKSPGAYLIRQDTDADGKGTLIADNIDKKLYIHNNIFIVNQNDYGKTTGFPTTDYYTETNNFFDKTQIFGLLYCNFSRIQTKGTTSFIAGAAIGSEYVLDGTSSVLEMQHIMLADYYDRLERPGVYNRNTNRYLYNRNVMPKLLRKTPDDADAETGTGKTIYTFITEGFR